MLRKTLLPLLGGLTVLTVGCSGRSYHEGFVRREHAHFGLFDFDRDEQRESWAVLCEHLLNGGTTSAGNFYLDALGGAVVMVNIPGISMVVIYPFQYFDQPIESRHVFGVGSGEGDLRLSVLWGFLSIGRNWNIVFLNGFWALRDDPLFSEPSPEVRAAFERWSAPEPLPASDEPPPP